VRITDINTVIKMYQKERLSHLERMPENQLSKLFYEYKLNGRRCQGHPTGGWYSFNTLIRTGQV
jgi:hypothetical protein